MTKAIFDKKRNVYLMKMSKQDFLLFSNRDIENSTIFEYEADNTHYLFYNPSGRFDFIRDDRMIEFDYYSESKFKIDKKSSFVTQIFTFYLEEHSKYFNNIYQVSFKLDKALVKIVNDRNGKLQITIDFNSPVDDLSELGLVFFYYFYFLLGVFIKLDYKITCITESGQEINRHIVPTFGKFKNNRYSRFSVPITPELFVSTANTFINTYLNNLYPIGIFFKTQTDIEYDVQQRVSLILNSLEGFIKRNMDKNNFRVQISKSERTKILKSLKANTISYLESEDFTFNHLDINTKERSEYIMRLQNSLSKFSEVSFDEMLEISKLINKNGLYFVRKINPIPFKIWKRCKDHRNFHAHLTDDNHKGFNGTQSLYAIYILSNYFRLLVLEVTGINEFNLDVLTDEYTNINDWIIKNNLTNRILEIDS